jgi:hypothetical protein
MTEQILERIRTVQDAQITLGEIKRDLEMAQGRYERMVKTDGVVKSSTQSLINEGSDQIDQALQSVTDALALLGTQYVSLEREYEASEGK